MHLTHLRARRQSGSSLIASLIMTLILGTAIAGVGSYVAHNTRMAARRSSWASAYQFAEAGTVVACNQINIAFTNTTGTFRSRMVNNTNFTYALVSSNNSMLIYARTNGTIFTNQPVRVTLRMTNSPTPNEVTVESSATVNGITRTNSALLQLSFGWSAAIVSDHRGTSGTGLDKATAMQGNVVRPLQKVVGRVGGDDGGDFQGAVELRERS